MKKVLLNTAELALSNHVSSSLHCFSSASWLLSLVFDDENLLQDSTALILESTCLVHIKELHLLF